MISETQAYNYHQWAVINRHILFDLVINTVNATEITPISRLLPTFTRICVARIHS